MSKWSIFKGAICTITSLLTEIGIGKLAKETIPEENGKPKGIFNKIALWIVLWIVCSAVRRETNDFLDGIRDNLAS